MRRRLFFAIPVLVSAAPLVAAPGGQLDTIPVGAYQCELPGDATGPSRFPLPEESFSIRNASSYATPQGSGSYLLTGDRLVMTSGPKRGAKYHRISDDFLRKLDANGKDSTVRCVRRTRNGG